MNKTFMSDNTITKKYKSEIFKVPQYADSFIRRSIECIFGLLVSYADMRINPLSFLFFAFPTFQ